MGLFCCIFCKIVAGEAPSWKVMENEHAYAFLDINPVSRYHTLVIHYHIVPGKLGDGQNIRWKIYPEWRGNFDEMLAKILD